MAIQGEPEGTVIIAEEQTEGRGTRGRVWYSEKAKGLYISVILRPRMRDMSLLPLVAGLAVRDALFEAVDLPVMLKWPNDLVFKGKKLGGILCEASFLGNAISHVVLGVGLNVDHDREDFPATFRSQATSLKILLKKKLDVQAFLIKLWEILDDWYGFFKEGKKAQIIRAFEEYSAFSAGDEIVVETENGGIGGKYEGIDLQGCLLLRTQGIQRSFLAAEVLRIKKDFKEA